MFCVASRASSDGQQKYSYQLSDILSTGRFYLILMTSWKNRFRFFTPFYFHAAPRGQQPVGQWVHETSSKKHSLDQVCGTVQ